MTVLSDHDARQLISVDGLDQTLFVEAGAGTGKTTQLVDRIVNTVIGGHVRLSEIAAITFTEAAASELQVRIRVQFERRALSDDSKVRERAIQAIADVDLAAISTVHGFASRLLGEFCVAAGLPPRISVLDEVASQIAAEQRWERFVDWLHSEESLVELMYRAALIDVPLSAGYPGQPSFRDVAQNFAQNWDRLDSLLVGSPAGPLPSIDFSAFDDAVDTLAAITSACTNPDDRLLDHLGRIVPEMRQAVAIEDDHRKLRRFQTLHRNASSQKGRKVIWGRSGAGAKGNWNVAPSDVKDLIDAVNDALCAVLDDTSHAVLDQLARLTAREVRTAARVRQHNGGLEFHDLLVLARQVLRDNPEVRRILHERYHHVLLDEFQDTDPIQIELASLIAATPADVQPARWQEHDVAGGRLFFVGDPKQSIYRFRRADIRLFLQARDTFAPLTDAAVDGAPPTGGPTRLETNFRTVEPIIDWVNSLFGAVMSLEVPNAQPLYVPLRAGRFAESGAEHRPLVLGGEHPDPKVKAGALRAAEAADVAGIVATIIASPEDWPVYDEADRCWRPARLGDVTILIPTRTSLPYLREALSERRLAYRLATGTLVYDTQEVRDALAVLRAVDDPNDTLSLIAALRSPLYGCSDVDLFVYHQVRRRWNLRDQTPDGLTDDHPVVAAMAHLRSLWEQRWWTSPATMLERVVRERHGFLLGFGTSRPVEVWRRLRFLIDQARAFEESDGGGLRSFLDWADLQSAEGARVHEPMLPETDDDALQILTVHGAKGLEFPITILSGMTTAAQNVRTGVSVLWAETGPPAIKLRSGVATAEHHARADLEEQMGDHEKLRLLYVAATRARDHLIVSGHHKAGTQVAATYAARVAKFSSEHTELCRPVMELVGIDDHPGTESSAGVETRPAISPLADRDTWIEQRAALLDPFMTPSTLSATAIARTVDNTVIGSDDDTDDDTADADEADRPTVVRKQGRAGSAIGSAVHATMEFVDFDEHGEPDEHGGLDALVRRQSELHGVTEHVDTVGALVRSALASDAVDLARRHPCFRELYVAAPLGATMVEGYVDLLVQTPEGLIIVDYKTDSASSPAEIDAKLAAYELQGAAYAVALEESTGLDVVECRFVFCRTSKAIERSVADLADAKRRVRDWVADNVASAT